MNIIERLVLIGAVLIVAPFMIFLIAKMATYGYLTAVKRFNELYKEEQNNES